MQRTQWFLSFLLASGCAIVPPAPPLRAASWTDRGEYDLVLQFRSEALPEKRLALLDEWKRKYPRSELRQARRELYLASYQLNGDGARMLDVAREMMADDPKGFVGLYWAMVLVPGVKDPKPDVLDAGEKAARQLLAGLSGYFAGRPGDIPAADAAKQRPEVEFGAHRTLGWVQWQRRDFAAAATEFSECLRLEPKDAEVSSWFGAALVQEGKPENRPAALWHLARAASVQGESALSQDQRRDLDGLLEQLYTAYHGSVDGLTGLRGGAAASPLPPAGFTIEPADVVAARRQREELLKARPDLAPWLDLRQKLEAPGGDAFFNASKGTDLPTMKGTLIRFEPSGKPKRLFLGVADPAKEEVVIDLAQAFPNEAELGTQLEFTGKPSSFSREPFRITIDAERSAVQGWPAPPPVRRRK